jgi:hypothetical protein
MPAASQVQVHRKWIDKALAARPDLREPLVALLDQAASADPADAIAKMIGATPIAF